MLEKSKEASVTDSHSREGIDLPKPTAWPMILAFGLTLAAAGIVTNALVSIVGLILILASIRGLFVEVFPHAKHERVALQPLSERSKEIAPALQSVAHLKVGKELHRVRIPVDVHPNSAGVIGGLAGGAVMAVLAMAYGLIFQGSIWYPINLLAATGVATLATADTAVLKEFSLLGLTIASVIHLSGSVIIGLLYTVMLPMLPRKLEWLWAGIVAPLIWSGVLHSVMGVVNPALASRIDWPWFVVCQVAFGLVGGFVIFKTARVETMQTWPLAARMGIESQDNPERENK
ncbi:MAG: hypothetical protein ACK5LK_10190 [Chthoniobacterales bacterium]